MTEKIVIIILAAVVFALLIALSRALEAMWRYKQRVFELTNGLEGSNLPRVSDAPPPPTAPSKETTLTALMELNCKRMDEWRDELGNHYRTDLTDVSTAWHVCKLDEEGKAIFPINIPADIAVKLFGRMSNHLNRKLARHKENMKKGPDIY